MRTVFFASFLTMFVAFLPACSSSSSGMTCSTVSIDALGVSVTAAGTPVCDAVVVATDGSYREQLAADSTRSPCSYFGAADRPGTYVVTATYGAMSAASQTATVPVDSTGCHVVPQSLTFDLGNLDIDAGPDSGS